MGLEPSLRTLVEVSSALGAGRTEDVRPALEEAVACAGQGAVEETLLQAYLFVGFPPVLRAMESWRSLRGGAPASEAPAEGGDGRDEWRRRGEALCRQVYGTAYTRLRSRVRGLHPALDRWMIEEGYGKVLSRPGLDPLSRELCIVALLAAAGHEPQLHSHLRGSLELGGSPEDVEEALEAGLARRTDPEEVRRLLDLWAGIRRRAGTDVGECS